MGSMPGHNKFVQQALKYGFSLFGPPKTGQQTVYLANDDGTYQKGYPKTGVRFTDNGDGTVTDRATGLMWVKDPINNPGAPFNVQVLWPAALTNCEGLTFAGYSDWRLPNINELLSIVNYGNVYPAIGEETVGDSGTGAPFINTQSDDYWASTTDIEDFEYAWYVDFNYGTGYLAVKTTISSYVRPVRLGV